MKDILTLLVELKSELERKYDTLESTEPEILAICFDMEKALVYLSRFNKTNETLIVKTEDRFAWETYGSREFETFWSSLCALRHIKSAQTSNTTLTLLPHDATMVFRKFRSILVDIIWNNKYENIHTLVCRWR